MTTYRVGSHHGVTICAENDGARCGRPDHDCARGHLVAVVVDGTMELDSMELAERICALLNGGWYPYTTVGTDAGGLVPSARPSSSVSAEQPPVGGSGPTGGAEGVTALSGGCDCGHEGLDAMFHLSPCPVAELSRTAGRLGYELTLSRWETVADSCTCRVPASKCDGYCSGNWVDPDCSWHGTPIRADPACPVHEGRRAKGPKLPPVGLNCVCDGSGRACPRHGVVL